MVGVWRVHVADIVGVEGRLFEEGRVEMVALTRREEGEVTLAQIGREEVVGRLRIEGQARISTSRRQLLVEAGTWVKDGGVVDVLLGVSKLLLLLLLRAQKASAGVEGAVVERLRCLV